METSLQPSTPRFDIMAASEQQHSFLKPDDLHHPSPSAASTENDVAQGTPPPPVLVHSKPAKKRKSWGQELPEPKTALPPRKRAKTEDEKEQRRIERIKRNRAAAHNSRERKRQETETLAVQLARVNAEIEAYRKLYGPLPASVVLPEVTLVTDSADTPAPSLVESRGSIDTSSSPATTTDDLFENNVIIKQEPTESTFPTNLPPTFEGLDSKAATLPLFDLTQHSAAMLCDLQCRSTSNRASTQWWAAFLLYLMTVQIQTTSQALVMTIWTLFPSQTARLIQASTRRLTSPSTTSSIPLQSQSTVALAQRNAATATLLARRRKGVHALSQRSLMQAYLRARARAAAARQQSQTQSVSDTRAFEEGRETDFGMGEGDSGVGR